MPDAALIPFLSAALDAQCDAVRDWHVVEARESALLPPADASAPELAQGLVLVQHLMNFQLWHVEDTARRTDVDDAVIASCKRRIDGLNQRRNDYMERVDAALLHALAPLLPPSPATLKRNTESMGMAVDRLSILALKIYHMEEQTRRPDAGPDHRTSCCARLELLREQRQDLRAALFDLVEDFLAGDKCPKVYYQVKMYNDPHLNPELYMSSRG